MGWSASTGTGLGKDGTGIVVPLGEGQKVRKKGEGIKGGERTKASWEEEARRKGISVKELMGIDKEEEGKELGKREKKKEKHKEAWAGEGTAGDKGRNKREKKVKTEFKTYEEILAENGVTDEGDRPRELLVDLAGNAVRLFRSPVSCSVVTDPLLERSYRIKQSPLRCQLTVPVQPTQLDFPNFGTTSFSSRRLSRRTSELLRKKEQESSNVASTSWQKKSEYEKVSRDKRRR